MKKLKFSSILLAILSIAQLEMAPCFAIKGEDETAAPPPAKARQTALHQTAQQRLDTARKVSTLTMAMADLTEVPEDMDVLQAEIDKAIEEIIPGFLHFKTKVKPELLAKCAEWETTASARKEKVAEKLARARAKVAKAKAEKIARKQRAYQFYCWCHSQYGKIPKWERTSSGLMERFFRNVAFDEYMKSTKTEWAKYLDLEAYTKYTTANPHRLYMNGTNYFLWLVIKELCSVHNDLQSMGYDEILEQIPLGCLLTPENTKNAKWRDIDGSLEYLIRVS